VTAVHSYIIDGWLLNKSLFSSDFVFLACYWYIAFLLSLYQAPQPSQDVPADADFLCDTAAGLSVMIKEIIRIKVESKIQERLTTFSLLFTYYP